MLTEPLRWRFVWLLPLVIAPLLSIAWLGFLFFSPKTFSLILFNTPKGLIWLFDRQHFDARNSLCALIHCAFWPLYLTGLLGAPKLNIAFLRILFFTIVITLVLTLYGCSEAWNLREMR